MKKKTNFLRGLIIHYMVLNKNIFSVIAMTHGTKMLKK